MMMSAKSDFSRRTPSRQTLPPQDPRRLDPANHFGIVDVVTEGQRRPSAGRPARRGRRASEFSERLLDPTADVRDQAVSEHDPSILGIVAEVVEPMLAAR